MHNEILCLLHFCRPGFSDSSYSTMEFNGLTSASHMSLPGAGYGSEEGQLGSEISGAVSGVTTPGASRLQASQLQERSATMQRLQRGGRGGGRVGGLGVLQGEFGGPRDGRRVRGGGGRGRRMLEKLEGRRGERGGGAWGGWRGGLGGPGGGGSVGGRYRGKRGEHWGV